MTAIAIIIYVVAAVLLALETVDEIRRLRR